MKNILKLLLVFILITSCEDELDINTNPNTPPDVDKRYVLTAAQASLATILGGDLTNFGGFMVQYHTQAPGASQYLNIDTYNINTTYAERLWSELYAGCLNDLNYVISESVADEDTGTYLIATLLKVYTFQILTDLFGAIPYSEALQGGVNITPVPDDGELIYPDLIATIGEALNAYQQNPVTSTVGEQDAIYNAEMEDWIRFANTLLLKLYLRMSYTPMANATAISNLLADDNFITEDVAFSAYDGEVNKSHPFYDVQIDRLGDVNNIASNSLLMFYQENGDPRIQAVYRTNNEESYQGIDQGDRESFSGSLAAEFSRPNIASDAPVYLMTVAERNFLQAEALIRYEAGVGADFQYNNGIINSFLTYGLEPSDAEALIGAGGNYEYVADADIETAIRQVMIQKWAALAYINTIEVFFEMNRTKYPEITEIGLQDYSTGNLVASVSSILTGTLTPSTLFYPDNEVDRNPNITQKTAITEKVWWDVK